MTIDEQIDAGDLLQQIDGAVAGGLLIDAQVAQADDVIAVRQSLYLLLSDGKHILAGSKAHALDLGGVGLGSSLRRIQTKHADGGTIGSGKHRILLQSSLTINSDVGSQDGELSLLSQSLQVLIAIVELVVAGDRHIVTDHVHQLNSSSALRNADGGLALNEVTSVHNQDVSALSLILGLQSSDLGITIDGAMDIVGMQDHNCAVVLYGLTFRLLHRRRLRGLRVLTLCESGDRQAERHNHRQQQSKKFVPLSHACSS